MFLRKRVTSDELLDEHDAPFQEMRRSLIDLQRINRWAGGRYAFRRLFRQLTRHVPHGRFRVLDLGSGTSDLFWSIDDQPFTGIAIDFKIDHLLAGREFGYRKALAVVADAKALPLKSRSVDVVTSSHFFHHFSPAENFEILLEAERVSRIGLFFTDTRRHLIPFLFIRLVAALRLVGEITRFDGPASVRQGYTLQEIRTFARCSGRRTIVRRILPFRWALLTWND